MQGELCDLGRVLMQGSFSVWITHKRGPTRMKELTRFKPMQRHLFLYEHALLFCKRRDDDTQHDRTPFYSFKHCLRVSAGSLYLTQWFFNQWSGDHQWSLREYQQVVPS